MTPLIGWIVIGVVVALFLTGAVLSLGAGRAANPSARTRVMLVLLRLAIGWHFFVEGMDKLNTPAWTSAGYLREATGPLAPRFRDLAGDPVIDKLTDAKLIDADRQAYSDAVSSFYHLDSDQAGKVREALEPAKKYADRLLTVQPKTVEKTGAYPPPFKLSMTVAERIAQYDVLQAEVRKIEEGRMPRYGSEAFDAWKTAKTDANRWRGELKKDLTIVDHETKRTIRLTLLDLSEAKLSEPQKANLHKELRKTRQPYDKEFIESFSKVLSVDQQKKLLDAVKKWREQADTDLLELSDEAVLNFVADKKLSDDDRKKLAKPIDESRLDWDALDRMKEKQDEKISEVYRTFYFAVEQKNDPKDQAFLGDPFVKLVRDNVLEKRTKDQSNLDPLPFAVTPAVARWTPLDWSDHIVKYGILAVGAMLLAGFLTRLACVSGASFLLMFFLAMPSLPGWPESPKAEGHYLYINKTVIEMLALLVLGTTRSGRWLGVDGLLQFLCPSCWRTKQEHVKM